jgi:hypothetical protein
VGGAKVGDQVLVGEAAEVGFAAGVEGQGFVRESSRNVDP